MAAIDHAIRLGLELGYESELTARPCNGALTDLGIGYRLGLHHFLFDVGAGLQYEFTHTPMDDLLQKKDSRDEQGMPYVAHHSWHNRATVRHAVSGVVPIILGAQWNKFYFLVGVKASACAWGMRYEKGLYSISGEYDRYIEPFDGMPNHGFITDEPYQNESKSLQFETDVRATAELAYQVYSFTSMGTSKTTSIYLGPFAEYGLWNSLKLTPWVVGVKATVVWNLPKKGPCMCMP